MTDPGQEREALEAAASAIRKAQDGFTEDPAVIAGILEAGDVADYLATKAIDARAELTDIHLTYLGKPLALLCFERDRKDCHRSAFAEWWEQQTGENVTELDLATSK
jgi:hypothetical protein